MNPTPSPERPEPQWRDLSDGEHIADGDERTDDGKTWVAVERFTIGCQFRSYHPLPRYRRRVTAPEAVAGCKFGPPPEADKDAEKPNKCWRIESQSNGWTAIFDRFGQKAGGDIRYATALDLVTAINEDLARVESDLTTAREEIARLKQAIWDACAIMGMDTDGNVTPAAFTGDMAELLKREAKELSDGYNKALDQIPFTADLAAARATIAERDKRIEELVGALDSIRGICQHGMCLSFGQRELFVDIANIASKPALAQAAEGKEKK